MKQLQLISSFLVTGAISAMFAPPAWADVTQVTAVRLNPTDSGLQLLLETPSGRSPQVLITRDGETLIAHVINAQLRLREGQDFRQSNPVAGIASIFVTQQTGNSIRVAITGTAGLPQVQVVPGDNGLTLSLIPPAETTSQPAQPSQPPTAADIDIQVRAESDSGYQVENTTSATRTDTPLRDIPQSIQVVPQQVLQDQQVNRVTDAVRNVSGVVQDGGFGGTEDQLNIRGFFANIARDGFNDVGFGGGFRETANLERVEVLKGPSSVLFGNLEPGGIVNLVTKKPLAEPYYFSELPIGNYGFFRPSIDFSGPLNSEGNLLYRLNAVYERSNGFRDFNQDVQRYFIAPVLSWKISDATRLTVEFDYLNDERPFDRGLVAVGTGVADIPVTRFLGEPDDIRRVEQFQAGYQLEHQFSERLKLRNAFRYGSSDVFDYRAEPIELDEGTGILARNYRSNDDYSESFALQTDLTSQFTTGSIAHTLILGFDLARQTSQGTQIRLPEGLTPDINIFEPVYEVIPRPATSELTNVVRDNTNRTDAVGIFLQDQIVVSEQVKLLLGGRFDFLDQESENDLDDSASSQYQEAFSPRVGVVYQPTEAIALYASYSRSFQPNSGTRADGTFLEPERGTQYEVGVKAGLFDNRLAATLAFYDITKTNIAITDPTDPDSSIPAGEITSQGIELDVIGEILPGWRAIASFGYNDTRVTESVDPVTPVGLRTANVPRYTASLWTTYEIQSGNLEGLGFGAGLFYVGEREGDFENTYQIPSYLRTDAAIYYRRNNWRAALNFQNLFDIDYFKGVNFGRVAIEPGAPFTVIGSVSVEF